MCIPSILIVVLVAFVIWMIIICETLACMQSTTTFGGFVYYHVSKNTFKHV